MYMIYRDINYIIFNKELNMDVSNYHFDTQESIKFETLLAVMAPAPLDAAEVSFFGGNFINRADFSLQPEIEPIASFFKKEVRL